MDWTILIEYIRPIEEPKQWLPIVVLVFLVFELKYLMFLSPNKQELVFQLQRSELLELYYEGRIREYLLTFLAVVLAWSLVYFFSGLAVV